MAIDLSKMPKLGFGLMRLPEKDGEMEIIDEVTKIDLLKEAAAILD